MRLDKCQEVWYKTATPDEGLEETARAAPCSLEHMTAMIETLNFVHIAIIIGILAELLIIREQMAVGRVPA
jgi:hypothetical protein